MAGNSSMARSVEILRFVLKHRRAGVFSGAESDVAAVADEAAALEGGCQKFCVRGIP